MDEPTRARLDTSPDKPGTGFVPILVLVQITDPMSVTAPLACNVCGGKCLLILHIRDTPLGGLLLSAFCPAHADSPMAKGEVPAQRAYVVGQAGNALLPMP